MKRLVLIFFTILLFSCSKNSKEDTSNIITIDFNVLLKGKNELDYEYPEEEYANNGGIINTIESGGKTWTIRHLVGSLSFNGWREDVVDILDNPRGNVIYRIIKKPSPKYDHVYLLAITQETDSVQGIELEGKPLEEHWVKILIDYDKSGWIFGEKLSVERCGPKYLLPEYVEPYILDGSNGFARYYVKENVIRKSTTQP